MLKMLIATATLLALGGPAAVAATPNAATIAKQGNGHGAPACASCHGADGGGQTAAGFPRLAGLNEAYLLRQMDAFASGSRENSVMKPIMTALSADERKALAAYYSKLPIPSAAAKGSTAPANDAQGERLAVHGRWSKQVPGCVQCHGPHGVGVGAHFPPLAGQSAKYIADQMQAFKDGRRHNDPLGLMRHVASALDDHDIQAVATWFAAQPAKPEGGKP